MAGQGCPNLLDAMCARIDSCATKALVVFALAAALVLAESPVVFSQQIYPLRAGPVESLTTIPESDSPHRQPEGQRLRFRFSWGGGTAQTWAGKIVADKGSVSDVSPLGLTADAPASVVKVGKEIQIGHWSPTDYGGADISVEGDWQTEIKILLFSREHPDSKFERTVTLGDLVAGQVSGEIDLLGNRCSVVRVPGDELEVDLQREHLVFNSGEQFSFWIRPNATALTERTVVCRVRLMAAYPNGRANSRPIVTKTLNYELDMFGSAESQQVKLTLPDEEAVYNIQIELAPSRYQASFGPKKGAIERTVQLIVLESNRKSNVSQLNYVEPDRQRWRKIATEDPVKHESNTFPSWSQFSRMTGLASQDALGNELRSPISFDRQTLVKLAPGGWQAIPLTTDHLNKPHVIEIEYVADGELALGISVLQPDASGQIPTHGFDSGVYIPKSLVPDGETDKTIQHHRLMVWPKTKTPYLLVANRHANKNAIVGKVNIYAGPDHVEASEFHTERDQSFKSRKLMAFFETPLFSESFGARIALDPAMETPLDDWRMFYEGASRFIEYLKANSYRGAFVTVASDGSSIYPSQLMALSPKFDNGTFFSTGQDPIRKDVLEMLFRMFEREGLSLVPALAMSGPLSEVEALRKRSAANQSVISNEINSDFDMVDLNGATRPNTIDKRLPVYNPLDRTVQHAVRKIVQELSQRYKSFESFDGVAILCRPDTYTLLPGRQWGYNPMTVQRFFQLQSDLDSVPSQWASVQDILLGSHGKAWIQWRAAEMTKWYQSMANDVTQAIPNGKLYLAPVDLYRNEETASALSPSLHASADFDEIMLHLGFEQPLVRGNGIRESEEESNIVLLNPHRIAPDQTLSSQRIDLEVESSNQANRYFSQLNYAGDLFSHRISWAHFAQLQAQSPFGNQSSALMRLQQMTPAGILNRKRFAESLKNRDSRLLIDGGWMMSMGQEASTLEMMNVFGRLPDVRFENVARSGKTTVESTTATKSDINSDSVAIRKVRFEGQTYLYAVNVSPWATSVQLVLRGNGQVPELMSLSNELFKVGVVALAENKQGGPAKDGGSQYLIEFKIPPYGLVGARTMAELDFAGYRLGLPSDAERELRRHVFVLQSKLTKAGNPQSLPVLENPNFEFNRTPTMGSWDTGQQSTEKIRLETVSNATGSGQQPLEGNLNRKIGQASLLMVNDSSTPVWVRSNFFEPTETGRLSISVWLKTNDPNNQPPLRLALEGKSDGINYYRFGSVGSLSPDSKSNQLESRWKRFAVHFDDLPVDGLDNVRIGFDLMGPGQVSIDNVEVFDRWFDENDAKAITQLLASAEPLLSSPETFDSCRRLLEGYWPRFLDQFIELDDKESGSSSVALEPVPDRNRGSQIMSDRDAERKSSRFRRFRNRTPQKKSSLR